MSRPIRSAEFPLTQVWGPRPIQLRAVGARWAGMDWLARCQDSTKHQLGCARERGGDSLSPRIQMDFTGDEPSPPRKAELHATLARCEGLEAVIAPRPALRYSRAIAQLVPRRAGLLS